MKPTEINPSEYNSYYQKYIDLVDDVSLSEALEMGLHDTPSFFKNIPQAKWHYRYAENKWTPKDILQHIIDTERVFSYRALYFSRADSANLKGFVNRVHFYEHKADTFPENTCSGWEGHICRAATPP